MKYTLVKQGDAEMVRAVFVQRQEPKGTTMPPKADREWCQSLNSVVQEDGATA
jgi:hypothetical protein